MKFEELIKNIEDATTKIESGNVGLDESISLYEQAMIDCKKCYDILNTAKGKIEILNKEYLNNEKNDSTSEDIKSSDNTNNDN